MGIAESKTGGTNVSLPQAEPTRGLGRRMLEYGLLFAVCVFLFWLFRERSHSGDYLRWMSYLGRGMWYRLREPICLLPYKVVHSVLGPHRVSAKAIIVGFSYVCGGLSFCYIVATVRLLTSEMRLRLLGVAAFAASFGVVGIFFGHIEHYNIMSLGCFAYFYYAIRYLRQSTSIIAPGLALGLLGTTHLMAAWLFPSLVVLPWLRPAVTSGVRPPKRRRLRDLVTAVLAFGIPNIVVWVVILAVYYESSILNLLRDAATGEYSSEVHRFPGNALGGGNTKRFWTLRGILSWSHAREIALLLLIYSPAAWLGGLVTLVASRRADLKRFIKEPVARLALALLVPYGIYVATWEAGLGPAADWDLFSHISIFLLYGALVLFYTRKAGRSLSLWWVISVAVSAALTAYLVNQNHKPDTDTGIAVLFRALGLEP
jgi:hypothetical protein